MHKIFIVNALNLDIKLVVLFIILVFVATLGRIFGYVMTLILTKMDYNPLYLKHSLVSHHQVTNKYYFIKPFLKLTNFAWLIGMAKPKNKYATLAYHHKHMVAICLTWRIWGK
jgi:hypothetical protein